MENFRGSRGIAFLSRQLGAALNSCEAQVFLSSPQGYDLAVSTELNITMDDFEDNFSGREKLKESVPYLDC